MKKRLAFLLYICLSITSLHASDKDNRPKITDYLGREIYVETYFAGASITLVKEPSGYFIIYKQFGSGVAVVATQRYEAVFDSQYQITFHANGDGNADSQMQFKLSVHDDGLKLYYDGLRVVIDENLLSQNNSDPKPLSGNPVIEGWYADPDAAVWNNEYWIVPTSSIHGHEQLYFDAFSSPDLVNWTKYDSVVNNSIVTWGKSCFWAPGLATKDGKYYIFFSAKGQGFSHSIGVCVADNPAGPYRDLLGKPLLSDQRYNDAQAIDQYIFRDGDDYYMLYGGEGRCNIVKLNDDFTGFLPHADGSVFKEITPHPGYVEGPVVFKRDGKYYFMWSEGLWFAGNYRVAYGISDSLFGPYERIDTILKGDDKVAAGPGHHSVIQAPHSDEMYMVYHRKPLGDKEGNHRMTCIDKMEFDSQGHILPIKMTFEGVESNPIP